MPLQQTSGNVTADAYGGGVAVIPNYIEDVFSTYLYTGNDTPDTSIVNNINLSGKGGLVWIKPRSSTTYQDHLLFDTVRGANHFLMSNTTAAEFVVGNNLTAFNANGFDIGSSARINVSPVTYASWTFRKQPKFFDVVTYTGDGTTARNISHSLGSTVGCVIVKNCTDSTDWWVWHRAAGSNDNAKLNTTGAFNTSGWIENVTSTTFGVSRYSNANDTNISGKTYIAYLFAHNAGGFGLTGTDNVISCGVVTASSGNVSATLGYEPQFILYKGASTAGSWRLYDSMRGMTADKEDAVLFADSANAESTETRIAPNATGFTGSGYVNGATYIYIAIRRGPMKVPTLGTSVFSPIAYTGNSTTNTTVQNLTTNFAGDAVIIPQRTGGNNPLFFDKLRGGTQAIYTSLTLAEETITAGESVGFNNTQTVLTGQYTAQGNYNYSGDTFVSYSFQRAPGFFDEVCYTGTGTDDRQVAHNLGVAPELIICKSRSAAWPWWVGGSVLGSTRNGIYLNDTGARQVNADAFSTNGASFTSSYFLVSNVSAYPPNANTYTQVAYLFATCAGVSKVGSYTGNGSTQTINCGFTGGARFVLLKRTDASGDWVLWDSSRGMVAGTDPRLALNSTAAEVNANWVYTTTGGFQIVTSDAAVNASGGSYIFLSIA